MVAQGLHFILICKPSSHKGLYEALEVDRKGGFVERLRRTQWTGREHRIYDYQFTNGVPLRDGKDALEVNTPISPHPVGAGPKPRAPHAPPPPRPLILRIAVR